jgi:hypothetical protein
MAEPFVQLGVVALPLLCVLASEAAAASMFIAAFVAGLAGKSVSRKLANRASSLRKIGDNFSISPCSSCLAFWSGGSGRISARRNLLYAILSLTVVRISRPDHREPAVPRPPTIRSPAGG